MKKRILLLVLSISVLCTGILCSCGISRLSIKKFTATMKEYDEDLVLTEQSDGTFTYEDTSSIDPVKYCITGSENKISKIQIISLNLSKEDLTIDQFSTSFAKAMSGNPGSLSMMDIRRNSCYARTLRLFDLLLKESTTENMTLQNYAEYIVYEKSISENGWTISFSIQNDSVSMTAELI